MLHADVSMQGKSVRQGRVQVSCGAHVIVKVAIQAQDVGVAQVQLDLDLPQQLIFHHVLLRLRFVQRLQQHVPCIRPYHASLGSRYGKSSEQDVKAEQMLVLGIMCIAGLAGCLALSLIANPDSQAEFRLHSGGSVCICDAGRLRCPCHVNVAANTSICFCKGTIVHGMEHSRDRTRHRTGMPPSELRRMLTSAP